MIPIIDTHQHLWDLSRFELPWVAGAGALNRSFLANDYAAAIDGAEVAASIYMEVDMAPHQRRAEAEYILEHIRDSANPTAAAVLSGDPGHAGFADYVAELEGQTEVKGIRRVLHVAEAPRGACLQDEFVAGLQLLGRKGLSFDVCIRPEELDDAATLAQRCPDTRLVLDHCGNADPNAVNGTALSNTHDGDQWRRGIERVASQPSVICKISGIVARARPGWTAGDLAPTIDHCLDVFGPDRVVFGGDWPVCTLGASLSEWASALRDVISRRSEAEQRQLLHENARLIYRL